MYYTVFVYNAEQFLKNNKATVLIRCLLHVLVVHFIISTETLIKSLGNDCDVFEKAEQLSVCF